MLKRTNFNPIISVTKSFIISRLIMLFCAVILVLFAFIYVFVAKIEKNNSLTNTALLNQVSSNQNYSDDANAAGVKMYGTNDTGMINTYVDPVVLQKLYRVNWQKNKYSKPLLKSHGKSSSNNYGLNYWINTTLPDKNTNSNNDRVVTQLPNSGDVLFARDAFGTDMLRSALWKKPLAGDPNKNAADNYYKNTDHLASLNAHRSFFHFGIDFGLPISLIADDPGINTPDSINVNHQRAESAITSHLWFGGKFANVESENSKAHKSNDTYDIYSKKDAMTIDSHNIFSSLLNSSSSKNSFASMPNVKDVITTNNKNLNIPNQKMENLYDYLKSARAIRPPFETYKLKLFNIDPSLVNQSSSFMIGTFGLVLNDFSSQSANAKPLYLTFTFQTDLNNSITNVNGNSTNKQGTKSEHLIIDVNSDAQSQLNEIGDIYNNLQSDENYSNAHKLAFLNALDGHSKPAQNTAAGYKWGIRGRETFSLIENNAFGEPAVINKWFGNIITSDEYNKNDPGRNINTGFHPEKFANFVLQQVWPRQSNNIDYSKASPISSIYCTKNRYKVFDGYQRDRTVKTTNPQIYTAPNYSTYDSMSLYETSFYFDTKYMTNHHYWKLGDYRSSSQYYFFTQVTPRPAVDEKYKSTNPMLAHFGSGVNKKKIALLWNSNMHFEVGGIVALCIILVIVIGALLFLRPWRKISILSTKNIDKYLQKAEQVGTKSLQPKMLSLKNKILTKIDKKS